MAYAQLDGVLRHLRSLGEKHLLVEASDAQLLERFIAGREEAAFAALLRRHGPMVLSVARRVLPCWQDAEDVFQAAFLLLARKAGSIRQRASVSSWLHGVAHRLALRAKTQQGRRQAHEKRAADMRTTRPSAEVTWPELQAVLDTALGELPEKYRTPLVLCYLEGKSHAEVAQLLGCPLATVRTRVARGRTLLRNWLTSRGLTLSTTGLAVLLLASTAPAATPAALVKATLKAALPFAAGQTAATLCPGPVAELIEGGLKTMFLSKIKTAMAVLLVASLLAGAGALMQRVMAHAEAVKPPAAPGAQPPTAADEDSLAYGGRVLGPDGRPVAGAKLYMTVAYGYAWRPEPSPIYATTGPDGRFKFAVRKAAFGEHYTVVAAAAANHGAGWVQVPANGKRDDLTLRLVHDEVPITGQVVDLEGKPIAGATLRVLQINAAPGEDLGPWFEAVRRKQGRSLELEQQYLKPYTIALSPQATTAADGRFRLTGIGRNRLVRVQLDGPTLASQQLCILTRPGTAIEVTEDEGKPQFGEPRRVTTYYGANFQVVAAPTKPIGGVVRDRDTKQPLAGVTIQSDKLANNPIHGMNIVQTTTDAQGRYRLTGLPKGEGNKIMLVPPADRPYVAVHALVPDSPGLDPVAVDFDLQRGVWIEGRITDKVSGQPLQASVEYFALYNNPNLSDYPGFDGTFFNIIAGKADGSYRVVGLPGPGLVAVYSRGHYLRAPERDDEYGVKERSLTTAPYHISFTSNYGALARINPAKGSDPVKRDVTLDPGWTFTCTLVGPDGKALAGARGFGTGMPWPEERERRQTTAFTVRAFNPRRPHDVFFQHRELGLVGVAQPPKEDGGSVTVHMMPGAAVTGRLVDADGRPRAGVELVMRFRPKGERGWAPYSPERIETDREGRFRVGALLTGYEYRLSQGRGAVPIGGALHLDQTKDLGDVKSQRP